MLWAEVRLLIAAGETKGYEWAATYLEERQEILPRPKISGNKQILYLKGSQTKLKNFSELSVAGTPLSFSS